MTLNDTSYIPLCVICTQVSLSLQPRGSLCNHPLWNVACTFDWHGFLSYCTISMTQYLGSVEWKQELMVNGYTGNKCRRIVAQVSTWISDKQALHATELSSIIPVYPTAMVRAEFSCLHLRLEFSKFTPIPQHNFVKSGMHMKKERSSLS